MISRVTGETTFTDLRILPQGVLPKSGVEETRRLPVPGWSGHRLGKHLSDRGVFEVEALCGAERRIQVLLLAHTHPFYEAKTPGDSERRTFHEGIISSDLAGQREFSWGDVLCRFNAQEHKDWLVLAFNAGPHVLQQTKDVLLHLCAEAPEPKDD